MTDLSIIIITKNEEKIIEGAIKSAQFADQIIVADGGSTDKTVEVAKNLGADVITLQQEELNFSQWRNQAMKHAKHDWVFYLDADERVSADLQKFLVSLITNHKHQTPRYSAFAIPRQNYYFGKRVKHGGSWPDYVIRLFYKPKFRKWKGKLHEQPEFEGELEHLKAPLEHYTHRDLRSMLEKSIKWTKLEAKLLYDSDHPPVVWWRIGRMMLTKFWQRVVKQAAWKDGTVSWINAIYEVFNTFMIYSRLWEMQREK